MQESPCFVKNDRINSFFKETVPQYHNSVNNLTKHFCVSSFPVFDGRVHFDDERLNEMLFRYRARNWPETLSDSERERWRELREARLINGEGGARTLEQFAEEIALMEEEKADNMTEADEELFGALYDWAEVMSESLES